MTNLENCHNCNFRDEKVNNPNYNIGGGNFNSEKFYKNQLSLLIFDYYNEIINLNFINLFDKISGVWSIWNKETNKCLQVGQNENIGKEIKREMRLFKKYGIKDYPKDHKDADYWHELGELMYNKQLEIKIIAQNIENLTIRLKIEAQYAHDNKSKYWSPEPGQLNLIMEE